MQPGPQANMAEVTIDQSKLPGVSEGRGRAVEHAGPLRLPAPGPLPREEGFLVSAAPAALAWRPPGAARRGREEIEFRFCCGTLGKSPKF